MRPVSACGIGSAIQATIMNAATASACLEAGSKFSGANQSSAGTAIVKTKPITFRVEIPISFAPPSCAAACTASAISISLVWRIPLPDQAYRLARQRALVNPHRSEEHTSELQSLRHLVCRLLLEKKKKKMKGSVTHRNRLNNSR